MQMVIEIPEELKGVGEAVSNMIRQVQGAWRSTRGGKALDYVQIERQLAEGVAAIERASHQAVLQRLDKVYGRVGCYEAGYYTMAGPVVVTRTLYRELGRRNAKTINAISLRSGAVGEVWLPGVAQAMAYQPQQGTSREAEATARILGRLPCSRSSFESVGHEVGRQYTAVHANIEEALVEGYEIPAEARSVSVALDRVSVPMEEEMPEEERAAQPGETQRQVWRNFRMAYCATLTLHDHTGEALHTLRYGRMPQGEMEGLCSGVAENVCTLLRKL